MATDDPNIVATDDEGKKLSDKDVRVNDILPGSGGGTTEEQVDDWVNNLLETATGSNLSLTYDDTNNTLTADTSALNEEEVEDAVAAMVTAGNGLTVSYDDTNDTLTIDVSSPLTGVQIGTSASPAPGSHFNSVNTGKADITGETWITAYRTNVKSGIASGTWTNIADTEDEDNLNEQDSNFNINVSSDGWRWVWGYAYIDNSNSGDQIRLAVRDVDAGTIAHLGGSPIYDAFAATFMTGYFTLPVYMTSGTNYRVQAMNASSSFRMNSGAYMVVDGVIHQ